jgi:tRNA threonylcarbamoyladenosine biosynthesis protein TsaB
LRVLAIDTCLADISAAVSREPGQAECETFRHERDALQRLAGIVRDLLGRSGLRPEDIELVVCTRGPGSFTGLRVGVAAAKAFAAAAGAQMAGPSTLAMLAANVQTPGALVVPLIEACPGEVYCGAYRVGGAGEALAEVAPDQVCPASNLEHWLDALGSPGPVIIGPAAAKYASCIGAARVEEGFDTVSILRVIEWGRAAAESGGLTGPLDFQPEYLRASHAEIRRAEGKG